MRSSHTRILLEAAADYALGLCDHAEILFDAQLNRSGLDAITSIEMSYDGDVIIVQKSGITTRIPANIDMKPVALDKIRAAGW